ncbi:unnamed protein product, partial [Pylaiella littoralis]
MSEPCSRPKRTSYTPPGLVVFRSGEKSSSEITLKKQFQAAVGSTTTKLSQDLDFVRLVRVYNNEELRQMISKEESCNSESAMYMVVSASCPAYYAEVEETGSGSRTELEIIASKAFADKSTPMTEFLGPMAPGMKMN